MKVLHLDSTGISSLKGAYDQPSLEEITFANTPFADLRYSRLMCALAFYPNLRKVNGVEISEKEKNVSKIKRRKFSTSQKVEIHT